MIDYIQNMSTNLRGEVGLPHNLMGVVGLPHNLKGVVVQGVVHTLLKKIKINIISGKQLSSNYNTKAQNYSITMGLSVQNIRFFLKWNISFFLLYVVT